MINTLTETERWTDDKQIHCSAAGKTKMKDDDVKKKNTETDHTVFLGQYCLKPNTEAEIYCFS